MDCDDQNPLHSAIKSNNVEAVKLALLEGVNIHMKDANGMTPLQILVQKHIGILRIVQDTSGECQTSGNVQLAINENIINLLLENDITDYDSQDDIGLSNFHAACLLRNSPATENISNIVSDINQSVNEDSPMWPGYTALHFAARCTNINTVKMLITRGADLHFQDAKGTTPLQICTELFSLEDVYSILFVLKSYSKIVFSDRKTNLKDYLYSLCDAGRHKEFLQNTKNISELSLPNNSPLWPGCTVLHLAVILLPESNTQALTNILSTGSNILNKQDKHGCTGIHLAFRQSKIKFVKLLTRHYSKIQCITDNEGLSILHISIALQRNQVTTKLFDMDAKVNVTYKGNSLPQVKSGWTPLHVAVNANKWTATTELLKKGANVFDADSRGFTPIHLLFGNKNMEIIAKDLLSVEHLKECVVEGLGLTHLHVAAWTNRPKAIKRLLDLGSDIEATIGKIDDDKLKQFVGYKPIHLAMMHQSTVDAFTVLLQRGADVFASKPGGLNPLVEVLAGKQDSNFFMPMVELLWNNKKLQNRIGDEMGVTMLHVACHSIDENKVRDLVEMGAHINAKTLKNSVLWPGFTPLHTLIAIKLVPSNYHVQEKIDNLIDFLLRKGVDVTVSNADGDTPVLLALQTTNRLTANKRAAQLLKHHMDFSVNPVNAFGMSHFHVACLTKDAETAQKFLKHTSHIDVDRVVTSSGRFAGQTPLLMALSSLGHRQYDDDSQVQLVTLLLERGARVNVADAFGYTSLHKIAACTHVRSNLLDKILIDNTVINKRANDGKTPMEILLSDGAPIEDIKYFVNHGARINSCNPNSDIGYMSIVLKNHKYRKLNDHKSILEIMMNSDDIAKVDEIGRNAVHNAVTCDSTNFMSEDYCKLFEKLIILGCDIHQKDNLGGTALHLAFKFNNVKAIMALLMCGADIDDTDDTGMTPPVYAYKIFAKDWWHSHKRLHILLTKYFEKCQLLGIPLSQQNKNFSDMMYQKFNTDETSYFSIAGFQDQVMEMKSLKIGRRGLTVYDILRGTKSFVRVKSLLIPEECEMLRSLIKSLDKGRYYEIWLLLKMQCTKALDRTCLFNSARVSFRTLIGLPMPDLCLDIILKPLNSADLRSLNKAVIKNDYVEMDVE